MRVILKFSEWFRNRESEWDCQNGFLIIDESVKIFEGCSKFHEDLVRRQYPEHVMINLTISRFRGNLEEDRGSDILRIQRPDIWDRLNSWCAFKRRAA